MSTVIRRDAWGRPFAVRTGPVRRRTFVDPFRAFDERFDALARTAFGSEGNSAFRPAAEVVREGDDAVLRLEIPGVDVEKDVAVEVTGRLLTVKGERRDERTSEDDGPQGHRLREVRYGSFSRSFTLPEQLDAEAVTATYDAGVLSVRVGGAYRSTEPRHIAVTSGAASTPAEPAAETEQGDQQAA